MVRYFNRTIPIRSLLIEFGACYGRETSIWCPFHPDSMTGHKSAAIRDESNIVFCFSEKRVYRPYDVLKLLGKQMEDYLTWDDVREVKIQQLPTLKIPESLYFDVSLGRLTLEQADDVLQENYTKARAEPDDPNQSGGS